MSHLCRFSANYGNILFLMVTLCVCAILSTLKMQRKKDKFFAVDDVFNIDAAAAAIVCGKFARRLFGFFCSLPIYVISFMRTH